MKMFQFNKLHIKIVYTILLYTSINAKDIKFSDSVTKIPDPPTDWFCPNYHDGFVCWRRTPANTTASQSCPDEFYKFNKHRKATKRCTENGTWYEKTKSTIPWSTYANCSEDYSVLAIAETYEYLSREMKFLNVRSSTYYSTYDECLRSSSTSEMKTVQNYILLQKALPTIYFYGYVISEICTLATFGIFLYLSHMRCTESKIHRRLFLSSNFENIFWIIWYTMVEDNVEALTKYEYWYVILHILNISAMMSTYVWIVCEGYYVYNKICKENETNELYFLDCGWIFSGVISFIYACNCLAAGTKSCWLEKDKMSYFIAVPVYIMIVGCFLMLIHAIIIITTDVRGLNRKKLLNALTSLMPLFGIQYVTYYIRPNPGSYWEEYYEKGLAYFLSLQGFVISGKYCFLCRKVREAIKEKLRRRLVNVPNDEPIPMADLPAEDNALADIEIDE